MFKDLFDKKNNNDYKRTRHDYYADEMNSYISDRDDDYNYPSGNENFNYLDNSNNYNSESNNDNFNYIGNDDSNYNYYTDDDFKDEYEKNHIESSDENELVYVVPDREKTTGKVVEIDGDKARISYKVNGNDYVFEYEIGKNEYLVVGQVLNLGYISDTPDRAYLLPNNNISADRIKDIMQVDHQSLDDVMHNINKDKNAFGYNKYRFGSVKTPSLKNHDFDKESEERYNKAHSISYEQDDWCKGFGAISDITDTGMIITYVVKGREYKIECSKTAKDNYKMGTVVVLRYKKSFPDVYEILEIKDHSKDDQVDSYAEIDKKTKSDNSGLFGGIFSNSGYGGMQALTGLGGMQTMGSNPSNDKSDDVEVVEWGETYGMIAEDNGEKVKVVYKVDEQVYSIWITKSKSSWKVGLRMKVRYNYSSPGIGSVMDMGNEHLTNRLKEEAIKETRQRGNYSYSTEESIVKIGLEIIDTFINNN